MKPIFALCVVSSISKIPKFSIKIGVFQTIEKTFISSSSLCRHFVSTTATFKESPIWGHKKSHRKIKLNFLNTMDSKTETILAPFRELVKEQVIRSLNCCINMCNYNFIIINDLG